MDFDELAGLLLIACTVVGVGLTAWTFFRGI